jgi:prepilin-type N-terminal cleavage/methylation domain-containing protein
VLSRRGVTLVELLVTMVVGGIALALVAAVSLRQQRVLADLADGAALSGQLRDAAAILPIDLRAVASGAGDIREAGDTSLEVRGTIASAVVCDTTPGGVILAPSSAASDTYAGYGAPPEIGDTAWVFSPADSLERWTPHRVLATGTTAAGDCASLGPVLSDSARGARRPTLGLESLSKSGVVGMPVRVTRALRYSLYRAADGLWYLGERDWNAASLRFNGIQPVSGPFLSPAAGGLLFSYRDTSGAVLVTPVMNTRAVSAVRIELRGQTRNASRAVATVVSIGRRHIDSVSIWVLLRNRR